MTTVPLSSIAAIHSGGRLKLSGNDFVEQGVPAYGAGGLNGFLPVAEYDDREAVILSSIGARCGKCFFVSGAWTSLANTQVILPDPKQAHGRFLWHQLNDEASWPRSGSAQPFIKPSDVKAREVWLPPMAEQQRIAGMLDTADRLRGKREIALARLKDLSQSIFLEMFGDPVANAKGWPRRTFSEVLTDRSRDCAKIPQSRFLPEGAYPIIDQGQKAVAGYTNDGELLCRPSGPVIIFGDHTRTVKLVDFPFVVGADGVKVLVPTPGIHASYIAWLLRLAPVKSLGYSRHMRELKRMTFPTPPMPLQETFAERTKQVEQHAALHAAGARESSVLGAVLRAQAFGVRQ